MKLIIIFGWLLLSNTIFAATTVVPYITKSVVTGTTFKFSETLSGSLPSGYQVKIDTGNGKGLVVMTCAVTGTGCILSSNNLPVGIDSATYKVAIYDNKGVLQGTKTVGNYVITGAANTFSYTKIANNGLELPDTAKLGSTQNDWACTKDNKTGLIWEVKTTDGGLRDMNKTYTNYTAEYPKCDDKGKGYCIPGKYGDSTNTDGFINAVNAKTLCGISDWRLPTNEELKGLFNCSDGKYNSDGTCPFVVTSPTIDIKYFPNTLITNNFWSSYTPDTFLFEPHPAGFVSFKSGTYFSPTLYSISNMQYLSTLYTYYPNNMAMDRNNLFSVRLVR
jgi:hypothetical protein